jgi:hypothetical protein
VSALACPACGREHDGDERFCATCGVPLVVPGAPEVTGLTDRQERARKVKPQYAEGPLVRVAGGRNQTEAEFIQALLLEEGVPSIVRRALGFDVPDFLAAGPRDVMVPASGVDVARDVLLQSELLSEDSRMPGPDPRRLALALLAGLVLLAVVAVVGTELLA